MKIQQVLQHLPQSLHSELDLKQTAFTQDASMAVDIAVPALDNRRERLCSLNTTTDVVGTHGNSYIG